MGTEAQRVVAQLETDIAVRFRRAVRGPGHTTVAEMPPPPRRRGGSGRKGRPVAVPTASVHLTRRGLRDVREDTVGLPRSKDQEAPSETSPAMPL